MVKDRILKSYCFLYRILQIHLSSWRLVSIIISVLSSSVAVTVIETPRIPVGHPPSWVQSWLQLVLTFFFLFKFAQNNHNSSFLGYYSFLGGSNSSYFLIFELNFAISLISAFIPNSLLFYSHSTASTSSLLESSSAASFSSLISPNSSTT